MTYLRGALSEDELLGVRPLVWEEDIFLEEDDPNPTGSCLSEVLPEAPPPDLMLELLRTAPPRGCSSELRDKFDPAREEGRDPLRLPD